MPTLLLAEPSAPKRKEPDAASGVEVSSAAVPANEGEGEGAGAGEGNETGDATDGEATAAKRRKAPEGATGHAWRPRWLRDFPWLRTVPDRTPEDWENRQTEAPEAIFCVCCYTYPEVGHTVLAAVCAQ